MFHQGTIHRWCSFCNIKVNFIGMMHPIFVRMVYMSIYIYTYTVSLYQYLPKGAVSLGRSGYIMKIIYFILFFQCQKNAFWEVLSLYFFSTQFIYILCFVKDNKKSTKNVTDIIRALFLPHLSQKNITRITQKKLT